MEESPPPNPHDLGQRGCGRSGHRQRPSGDRTSVSDEYPLQPFYHRIEHVLAHSVEQMGEVVPPLADDTFHDAVILFVDWSTRDDTVDVAFE